MASELGRGGDFARLNAFVDGELPPADRAAIAARLASDPHFAKAHEALARLKACVHASAEEPAGIELPPRRHGRWRPLLAAATIAAVACLAAVTVNRFSSERDAVPAFHSRATDLILAGAPTRPLLPRLDMAGLTLVGLSTDTSEGGPSLVASYLGPHGCRLDLRAGPVGRAAPTVPGSSRHGWMVDDMAYELVAHGMPDWRFVLIAQAAELQTRRNRLPQRMEQRLREARASAPPCAG